MGYEKDEEKVHKKGHKKEIERVADALGKGSEQSKIYIQKYRKVLKYSGKNSC